MNGIKNWMKLKIWHRVDMAWIKVSDRFKALNKMADKCATPCNTGHIKLNQEHLNSEINSKIKCPLSYWSLKWSNDHVSLQGSVK